jgi:hypothetical protein
MVMASWLESLGAHVEDPPEGTFKASGTMIRSKLLTIERH